MLIQNIKVAADSMIFSKGTDLQILLIRRKNDPFKGMWAFPGGFVEDDEELETAAIRELEEKFGFTNLYNLKGGILAYIDEVQPELTKY